MSVVHGRSSWWSELFAVQAVQVDGVICLLCSRRMARTKADNARKSVGGKLGVRQCKQTGRAKVDQPT